MEDARVDAPRQPGAALTAHESALLQRLCAGSWRGAEEARAQLAHARWGGKDHCGDACFLVDVTALPGLPRIPAHESGPIATLEVADRDQVLGVLELWTEDGLLYSLDYSTFSGPVVEKLPDIRLVAREE